MLKEQNHYSFPKIPIQKILTWCAGRFWGGMPAAARDGNGRMSGYRTSVVHGWQVSYNTNLDTNDQAINGL